MTAAITLASGPWVVAPAAPASPCATTGDPACFYVDARLGDDGHAGTRLAPWRTIQHAADVVRPGDTVVVNDGVYTGGTEVVSISRSGTPARWLVFRAAHRWAAVIDGRDHTSTTAIEITGSYVWVEGFEIRNTSRYGIDPEEGHDVMITQNHVHHIGHVCTGSKGGIVGIDAYSSNLTIERNLVHDIGRLGPGEEGCSPPNAYWQNHDHGIYHGVGDHVVIRNNVFYNLTHGWAIQRYDGHGTLVTGLTIANNTFVGANPQRPGQIIIATPTTDLLIVNNIFYGPREAAVWFDTPGLRDVTVTHNLTYAGPVSTGLTASVAFSENLDDVDPRFVSADRFDFHLQATSPAIGAGSPLSVVPNDFEGSPRPAARGYTIGAYEYR